jgi:aspartate carbamoyltransferase catalytic subunit
MHDPADPSSLRPAKRDLVSIDDFSNQEILELFKLAHEMGRDLRAWSHLCGGFILASLFYEPSTRTRLSFESAMGRLGGRVISAADMSSSSASKGESLADTVRVVGGSYADVIILRHPCEGAAKVAAEYAAVPVVNAGDGSHEHPTQTLCDLYSLWVEKGSLEGLTVVLVGDLRYSRTVHSFAYALARFRANLVFVPHPGLELPSYVLERLGRRQAYEPQHVTLRDFPDVSRDADVVYCTPQKPHQLSLFTEVTELDVPSYDALYVTRPQIERFVRDGGRAPERYLRIEPHTMAGKKFKATSLMHPLPRTGEIAYEMDKDPRSIYFAQAARGVHVRMALISVLLGRSSFKSPPPERVADGDEVVGSPLSCANPTCISSKEAHLGSRFRIDSRRPFRVRCAFCETERPVGFVGDRERRTAWRSGAPEAAVVRAEEMVLFESDEQVQRAAFAN